MRTVCGSEFQTDGAENRKARIEKSVLNERLDRQRDGNGCRHVLRL